MLEARDVQVSFGGVRAVDGVDLTVADGEIHGLVGPNGSGKSTFINALTGVVPASGQVVVDGEPLPLGRPAAATRRGILRTFQTPQTVLSLTCIDNVLLATADRRNTGVLAAWFARPAMWRDERERWARAVAALERVGLGALAEHSAAPLSYGRRRLLELAAVIAGDPSLILLDEPAAGLNAAETEQLAALLASLRDEGRDILLVEHKVDFLNLLCDRLTVLQLGRVVTVGPPEQVWRDEQVMDAYLGRVQGDVG